jgi:hypothetical protein
MNYLTRLKQLDNGEIFHHTPKPEPTKPTEPPFDGFVGLIPGANENIYGGSNARKVSPGNTATASRWWLVHYLDGAPVEVWTDRPATQAEVLQSRPDALAAQPLHQAAPEPITACSTCSRATYRDACGEPVAAGLSDVLGVIRYSPDQGATCPAWLAVLDTRLEECIRAMAKRWNYSGDDLAAALDGAMVDPVGWWRVVDVDEAFEERAAIMEYEGGLSREEAECQAMAIVGRTTP